MAEKTGISRGIDIYPMKAVDTDTGEEFKLETEQDYNDFAFDVFASMHPHEAAAHDWKRFVALCQKKNPKLTPKAIKKLLWETSRRSHEFPHTGG